MADLSFVIIEYRSIEAVLSCLAALRAKCVGLSHEFLISSNSQYPSRVCERLVRNTPDATWIFNPTNLGFAGAINRGICKMSARVCFIMNPQARLLGNFLPEARAFLLSQEKVGMLCPQLVDRSWAIQDSCRQFLTPVELLFRTFKRLRWRKDVVLSSRFDYGRIQAIDWAAGAAMMVKAEAIEDVGLLDERYFMYVEDMDWCKRFWDAGYQVVYYPRMQVVYKGHTRSTAFLHGGSVNRCTIYHVKSYLRYCLKHGLFGPSPALNGTIYEEPHGPGGH